MVEIKTPEVVFIKPNKSTLWPVHPSAINRGGRPPPAQGMQRNFTPDTPTAEANPAVVGDKAGDVPTANTTANTSVNGQNDNNKNIGSSEKDDGELVSAKMH